jgi:hypothetical protein
MIITRQGITLTWRALLRVQRLLKLGNNLGTEPPKHQVKESSRANQKARRVNRIGTTGSVCKTSIPGSNPRGASKFFLRNPGRTR